MEAVIVLAPAAVVAVGVLAIDGRAPRFEGGVFCREQYGVAAR